jgi:hypothetical protein
VRLLFWLTSTLSQVVFSFYIFLNFRIKLYASDGWKLHIENLRGLEYFEIDESVAYYWNVNQDSTNVSRESTAAGDDSGVCIWSTGKTTASVKYTNTSALQLNLFKADWKSGGGTIYPLQGSYFKLYYWNEENQAYSLIDFSEERYSDYLKLLDTEYVYLKTYHLKDTDSSVEVITSGSDKGAFEIPKSGLRIHNLVPWKVQASGSQPALSSGLYR